MDEEDYLLISDVYKYTYCKNIFSITKFWGHWEDNIHTTIGTNLHKRTDDTSIRETRGNKFISRGLEVVSHSLKIRGKLDTVEFYKSKQGVEINGRIGLWEPLVCEYKKKKGYGNKELSHIMQLTTQILCLEEMLGIEINKGVIVDRGHGNKRINYNITDELKDSSRILIQLMWETYLNKQIESPTYNYRKCTGCSLYNYCLPKLKE